MANTTPKYKAYCPRHWVIGDPAYIRNDGVWEFFGSKPMHIGHYMAYRDELMMDTTVTMASIVLVNDIIDSCMIVDRAIMRMKNNV